MVRVNDVATISDGFEEETTLQRINGMPTISVKITKSASADIIRTTDEIKRLIEKEKNSFSSGTIAFSIPDDDSVGVRDKFEIVKSNGAIGLILVFIVLAIFLNMRVSFWVAMGIPISLLGTLMLLPLFDVELDSLSASRRKKVIKLRDDYDRIVRKIIRRGIDIGCFPEIDTKLAGFMIASMITRTRLWYHPKKGVSVPQLSDFIFKFALDRLRGSI